MNKHNRQNYDREKYTEKRYRKNY